MKEELFKDRKINLRKGAVAESFGWNSTKASQNDQSEQPGDNMPVVGEIL